MRQALAHEHQSRSSAVHLPGKNVAIRGFDAEVTKTSW